MLIRKLMASMVSLVLLVVGAVPVYADSATSVFGNVDDKVWDQAIQANMQNMDRNSAVNPEVHRRMGIMLGHGSLDRTWNVGQVRAGLGKNGCSTGDMFADLQAMLNMQNVANGLESLAVGLVSEAPLLLICYYSPTICSYVKHVRNMLNAGVQIRSGNCRALEQFVDKRSKDFFNERMAACIDTAGGGQQAQEDCKQTVHDNPLQDLPLLPGGDHSFVQSGLTSVLQNAGMSEGDAKTKAQSFSNIFGDIVYRQGTGDKVRPTAKMRQTINSIYMDDFNDRRNAVDSLISNLSGGNRPSNDDLQNLSTPWFMPRPDELQMIYNWGGENAARNTATKLAELAARQKILSMMHEVQDLYSKTADATTRESDRASLQQMLKQMDITVKEYGGTEKSLADEANRIMREQIKAITQASDNRMYSTEGDHENTVLGGRREAFPRGLGGN